MSRDVAAEISEIAQERILVLDGAWGVLLQSSGLSEADFRGERFADHPRDLLNNPDLLNITQPDVVRKVHEAYFTAGAGTPPTKTLTPTPSGPAGDPPPAPGLHTKNARPQNPPPSWGGPPPAGGAGRA